MFEDENEELSEEQKEEQKKQEQKQMMDNLKNKIIEESGVKQAAKNAMKEAGKAALKKLASALSALLPIIIKIVLICVIGGMLMAGFNWVVDLLTANEVAELTTDMMNGYCRVDDDGIKMDKDRAISTIKEFLKDKQININDFRLGTDEQAYEYLSNLLAASLASELPFRDPDEEPNLSDEVQNGIVSIKRKKEETEDPVYLEYLGITYFNEMYDNGTTEQKRSLKDFYTLDENWNIIVVKDYEVKVNGSTTQYDLTKVKIPYRSMVNQYGMPFEFLMDLLIVTKNANYVDAVADLVNKNSMVYLTIFDSITTTTTKEVFKYSLNKKWVAAITKEKKRSGPDPQIPEETETIVIEDSIKANVTKAITWMVNQNTNYVCQTRTSTQNTVYGLPDEAEPAGDVGEWKTSKSIEKTVEIIEKEWVKDGNTNTYPKFIKFLGLWKNVMGRYVEDADYVPYGKVVEYYLLDSIVATDKPVETILNSEQYLYSLMENSFFAQTQLEYLKHAIKAYKAGDPNLAWDIDKSIFEPEEFLDINSGVNPSYEDLGLTEEDFEILCKITSAERGNGNKEQQMYVASVILNRVLSSKFPNTVRGVVFQSGQFQPVSNGRYFSAVPSSLTKEAVSEVIAHGDNTGCAVYFCTPYAAAKDSWWSKLEFLFNDGDGDSNTHNFYTTKEIKEELAKYAAIGGGRVIEEAKEAHKYVEENGYFYAQAGLSIPNGLLAGKTIDCSSYVSWVLYRCGLNQFAGYQKRSSDFLNNTMNFQDVGSISSAQAGDILVYNGHVEIYAGKIENNHPIVYNCGGNSSIQNPAPRKGGNVVGNIKRILRVPV